MQLKYLFSHHLWLGEAKVSCILRHQCIQLILAYSRARFAVLAAGNGRGGIILFCFFSHSFSFLTSPSLLSPLLSLLSLFSLSLGDDSKWPTRVGVSLNPNTIKNTPIISLLIEWSLELGKSLLGGGRVWRRCRISCVTWVSNWYWLTVGQGLLSCRR